MDQIEKVIEALQAEVRQLREVCERNRDRDLIENLVSRYQYYFAAGLGERIVDELWAHEAPTTPRAHVDKREICAHLFGVNVGAGKVVV